MTVFINVIVWNFRGAGKKGFRFLIKDTRNSYGFLVLVLLEPRLSGSRVDCIVKKLGLLGV